MAKAQLKVDKAPDLLTGASNPAASLIPAISFAGVNTESQIIVGGGAKLTDDTKLNAKLMAARTDEEDSDNYINSVVTYSDQGTALKRSKLSNLSDSREYMEVASVFNCALFAGGQDEKGYSRVVDMYTSFGEHRILQPLSSARTDMASVSLGNDVIFAGGDDGSGASDVVEVYTSNFTKRMAGLILPVAVKGLCGCRFGRYAVFAGGRTANGLPTDKVIAFDTNLNIISDIEPLSEPRYNLSAAVCTNPDDETESYLLIAGGKSTHTGFSTTVDVYDTNLKRVAAGLSLTVGRSRLKGASCGGYALFAGGVIGVEPNDTPTDIIDVFNYTLKRFDTMKLSEARNSLSAASFGDRALFAGGYTIHGLSKTVDMITSTPGDVNYAEVTYHFPSALVEYKFAD